MQIIFKDFKKTTVNMELTDTLYVYITVFYKLITDYNSYGRV